MPPNEISTEYHFDVYGQGAKVIQLTPPKPSCKSLCCIVQGDVYCENHLGQD